MSLPVNFPLPDELRERLLPIFEHDEKISAMVREGNPRLGRTLMNYHRQIDKPVSFERAIKLLDLDPKSEAGLKARKALYDPDRLYWLIRGWYEFMLSGPPVHEDFANQAKGWFPNATELQKLIHNREYREIDDMLKVAADVLLDRSFVPWREDEKVLGLTRETSYEERRQAAEKAEHLYQFFWRGVYESYLEALSGLPLAREYGYCPDEDPVAA